MVSQITSTFESHVQFHNVFCSKKNDYVLRMHDISLHVQRDHKGCHCSMLKLRQRTVNSTIWKYRYLKHITATC